MLTYSFLDCHGTSKNVMKAFFTDLRLFPLYWDLGRERQTKVIPGGYVERSLTCKITTYQIFSY